MTPTPLDRIHHHILETLVAEGRAPEHPELARMLGVSASEGRRLLHELMASGLPVWLQPGTDLIASFAPFNVLPTPYRLSIDRKRMWFGQCGVESLAATWLFPGKTLHIDATCLDCGEPLQVAVRDGVIERAEPTGMVLWVDVPLRRWAQDWPYT